MTALELSLRLRVSEPQRGESPTSSSSATPSAAPRRCMRCSGATRRSTCPTQGAAVLRARSACARRSRRALEQTGRHPETLDEYLVAVRAAQARPARRRGLDLLPVVARRAAAAIARLQPAARIIAILREPASFLRSLHLQMVQNHVETERDLRKAIALEGVRRQGERIPRHAYWPQALMYTERVRYVEQLRRYHAVFPRSRCWC